MESSHIRKNTISLLNLTGEYYEIENNYYFNIRFEGGKEGFFSYPIDKVHKLLDPTYDQAFKSIFTYGKNISSSGRLISFLNSVLHNKYKELIVKIEYNPNELVSLGDKGRKNLLVFDIIIKAIFESGKFVFIDIEMQTTYYSQLFKRWLKYATKLYANINSEILILVLQVDNKEESTFWTIGPYMRIYDYPITQERIYGVFSIINLDLRKTIELIQNNDEVEFGDIKINDQGKNWLKLMGMRFWIEKEGEYFYLPKIENVCREIIESMDILSCFTDLEVKEIISFQKIKEKEFEDGYLKGIEEGMEKGMEKGSLISDVKTWMRLFKKNINIESDLYPDFGKISKDSVKKLFSDEPNLESFIEFLKNNNKLLNE